MYVKHYSGPRNQEDKPVSGQQGSWRSNACFRKIKTANSIDTEINLVVKAGLIGKVFVS